MSDSVWDENPLFPVSDWQQEVANNDTRLGYADWVDHNRCAQDPNTEIETCAGCSGEILPGEGRHCHLKPDVYHTDECWGEHLGECIEED